MTLNLGEALQVLTNSFYVFRQQCVSTTTTKKVSKLEKVCPLALEHCIWTNYIPIKHLT